MVFEWTDEDGDRCGLGHWMFADCEVAVTGITEAVRQLATYRKALEPFATKAVEWLAPALEDSVDRDVEMELVIWLDRAERTALREACKLMGIEPAGAD